jgi:hypothetical protein
MTITRSQAEDMAQAHAEGYHSPPEMPREGCPECEDRALSSYPPFGGGERVRYGVNPPGTGTVVRCKRDRYGWDVLVHPSTGEDFWIGAGQLEVTR